MSLIGKKTLQTYSVEHSEPWLVSYADMMTLLFGFFVILYSFSQVDQERLDKFGEEMNKTFGKGDAKSAENPSTSSEARRLRALQLLVAMMNLGDDMDRAVGKIEKAANEATSQDAALKALRGKLQEGKKSEMFGMRLLAGADDDVVRIAIPDAFLFANGGSSVDQSAKEKLRLIARNIAELGQVVSVDVEGHTDSRQGKTNGNYGLSAARAAAVADELARGGLRAENLRTIGMGSSKPIFPEYSGSKPLTDNMARNRRVEIVVRKASLEKSLP